MMIMLWGIASDIISEVDGSKSSNVQGGSGAKVDPHVNPSLMQARATSGQHEHYDLQHTPIDLQTTS